MIKGVLRKAARIKEKMGLNALRKISENLLKSDTKLLNNDTHWRLLGTKNANKGEVIPATLLSALPGNNAATTGDTVAAEYTTYVDQTKNELNMCTSTAARHRAQGAMAREILIGATAIIRQRAFATQVATGLILGDDANKFDGVKKTNDEYETGTKNGAASAPFGNSPSASFEKQPRRYGKGSTAVPVGSLYLFFNV